MKIITINNVDFEVINRDTKKGAEIISTFKSNWLRSWYDLYNRPSREKEQVKDYWDRFFDELNNYGSYNSKYAGSCHTFSIYNEVDGRYFYITKAHNYVVI